MNQHQENKKCITERKNLIAPEAEPTIPIPPQQHQGKVLHNKRECRKYNKLSRTRVPIKIATPL
jgi:hypothetical protein